MFHLNLNGSEKITYNLFLCVERNDVESLEHLLQRGADPHVALYGVLPMYVAICHDRPECAKILSKYMNPGDMITSERMTCIQTCVRFQRFDLFKYFLQFESLASLHKIFMTYKYYLYTGIYGDIVLHYARDRIRRIEVLHMISQFEQLLNSDVAGYLAEYLYSADLENADSVSGCGDT